MSSSFYENFIAACKLNHIRPTPLLQELGMSTGNTSRWKSGVAISSDILLKLSERLNVSIDYLLTGENFVQRISKSEDGTVDRFSPGSFLISDFENELIHMFRVLSFEQQKACYGVIMSFYSQQMQEKGIAEKLSS